MVKKDKLSWIDKLRDYDLMQRSCERKANEIKQLEIQIERTRTMQQAFALVTTCTGMPSVCAHYWQSELLFLVLRLDVGMGKTIQYTFELHKCLKHKVEREGVLFACVSGDSLYIEDIQVLPNQGYGTMLLSTAIDFARARGMSGVIGRLSDVDLDDHRDRLLHFYHKHGFTITGNNIQLGL